MYVYICIYIAMSIYEQEQTRTDMKRRTSISVKEKTTYDTRRIKSTAISDNTTDHQS